jgi:hypothetical protein
VSLLRFRAPLQQVEHNLSLSGGTEKYYLSLGYNTQEGVAVANELQRYSFRTNIEHKLNKVASFGSSASLTRTDVSGLNTGRNSLSGNMFNAIRQAPNTYL